MLAAWSEKAGYIYLDPTPFETGHDPDAHLMYSRPIFVSDRNFVRTSDEVAFSLFNSFFALTDNRII